MEVLKIPEKNKSQAGIVTHQKGAAREGAARENIKYVLQQSGILLEQCPAERAVKSRKGQLKGRGLVRQ